MPATSQAEMLATSAHPDIRSRLIPALHAPIADRQPRMPDTGGVDRAGTLPPATAEFIRLVGHLVQAMPAAAAGTMPAIEVQGHRVMRPILARITQNCPRTWGLPA
jgi:hypothetical protein